MVHSVVRVQRKAEDQEEVSLCGTTPPPPPVCSEVKVPTASSAEHKACRTSLRLCFRMHQLLHHQVYIDDGTEVESPVEETVTYKLRDERPHEGEGKSLREHFPQVVPHLLRQSPAKTKNKTEEARSALSLGLECWHL